MGTCTCGSVLFVAVRSLLLTLKIGRKRHRSHKIIFYPAPGIAGVMIVYHFPFVSFVLLPVRNAFFQRVPHECDWQGRGVPTEPGLTQGYSPAQPEASPYHHSR